MENRFTDCQGWLWRISKEKSANEKIELQCKRTDFPAGIELGGYDCGEHLDAIAFNNNNWKLHIGTEDGEVLQQRALDDDWMPTRYSDELGFYHSFTSIESNGLITKVPELIEGERIHFHYITAYDKYRSDTANTWLAVDESKRRLENWIGIW
jgi:hypothetical protein